MDEFKPPLRIRASEEFSETESLNGTNPYASPQQLRQLRRQLRGNSYEYSFSIRLRTLAGALALSVVGVSVGAAFYMGKELQREETIPQPKDTCTGSQQMEVTPLKDVNQTIAQAINEVSIHTGVKPTVLQMRTAINSRNSIDIWQPGIENTWHLKEGYTSIVIPTNCAQFSEN